MGFMQQASVTEYHIQQILEMNMNVLVCVLVSYSKSLSSLASIRYLCQLCTITRVDCFTRNHDEQVTMPYHYCLRFISTVNFVAGPRFWQGLVESVVCLLN